LGKVKLTGRHKRDATQDREDISKEMSQNLQGNKGCKNSHGYGRHCRISLGKEVFEVLFKIVI